MTNSQKIIKSFAIILAIAIIISIFSLVIEIFSSIIGTSKTKDYNNTYEGYIKNIEIDLGRTNLIIEKGEVLSIDAKGVSSKFKVKSDNNLLSIKEDTFNLFANKKGGEVILTIPNDLDNLEIEMGAGTLELNEIYVKSLSIDQGAGSIYVNSSSFDKTIIDGGAGNINITKSSLSNLDLDMGAGKVTIDGNIFGNSKIDQGIGELIVNLDTNDYTFKVEKGMGSININDKEYKNDITLGTGNNIIDISGGIGSINITTK